MPQIGAQRCIYPLIALQELRHVSLRITQASGRTASDTFFASRRAPNDGAPTDSGKGLRPASVHRQPHAAAAAVRRPHAAAAAALRLPAPGLQRPGAGALRLRAARPDAAAQSKTQKTAAPPPTEPELPLRILDGALALGVARRGAAAAALSPSTEAQTKFTRTTAPPRRNDYEASGCHGHDAQDVRGQRGRALGGRLSTTKRHEGVGGGTRKKNITFIEAPGAAATDLFVHASEVTEPLRAGDKVSFVIGERRGRSAATKVEVLERAPPPPPRVFTPVAFGGQQAGFAPYQPYGYAGEVPESVPVFS